MDLALGSEYRWGVSKIFELRSTQRDNLSHEQRLRLKKDGRPCPRIKYQGRSSESLYEGFSSICGGESGDGKETFFCWPCLVMGDISQMKVSFVQRSGYTSGRSNLWNLAVGHQNSKKHILYHTSYQLLGNRDIACALDEAKQREVARHNHEATRYTKMIHHHIDAAVFLSVQGLAFRGHDESSSSSNRGNFIELLELLGNYSHEFRSFLDNDHVTYTSHDPQNQLIDSIADEVRDEIKRRVNDSRYIAVMMDDTSDASNVEQSAISVRLVFNGEVEEHLLELVDASDDQSANGLTKILLNALKKYGITPEESAEKLVGQSYDGAPTMSGELNGVQAQVQALFPAAYFNFSEKF